MAARNQAAASRPRRDTAPATTARAHKSRKHGPTGWVPNQHGAWMMVTLPVIIGLIYSYNPAHLTILIPLVIAWYTGYFCFFAFGLWAKAAKNRKNDFLTPVLVYGAVSVAAMVAVIAQAPHVIVWGAGFAPLVAIAVYEALKKRQRSLLSGESTVVAAALLIPAMVYAVKQPVTEHIIAVTVIVACYFATSIPFVKTLIRNRNDQRYYIGSIVSHILLVAVAVACVALGTLHWFAIIAFTAVAVRAWYLPWSAKKHGKRYTPKFIGQLEVLFTILVVIAIFLPPTAAWVTL